MRGKGYPSVDLQDGEDLNDSETEQAAATDASS